MASADFLPFVVTMFRFEYVYSFSPTRPPRVSVATFASYICCIYTLKFGQYWTSFCYGNSSVSSMPYMQFLFVRPRLCLRLPSDSTSRWTPLPLANSSYCQVCSGLSPPSDSACRAHIKGRTRRTKCAAFAPFSVHGTRISGIACKHIIRAKISGGDSASCFYFSSDSEKRSPCSIVQYPVCLYAGVFLKIVYCPFGI